VSADTAYWKLILTLFVMGLGMGATMMPLFTAALRTLREHEVARGSTLLNISQQVSSSAGVALMSVLLTNHLNSSPVIPGTASPQSPDGLRETSAAILSNTRPELFSKLHLDPARVTTGLHDAANSFAHTYWVAWALVAITLIPALLLPRRHEEIHLGEDADAAAPPVVL
jgi:hypothetical protein